jgi:flagellar basal-body rod protein FlgG
MNDALYIAATGMHAQQLHVDTIANNLANIATPAFKKGRVNFQDMVYRVGAYAGGPEESRAASGVARGTGVAVAALSRDFSAGELKRTDNPLDLAIQGDGFIEVTLADGGTAYGRGGRLAVNAAGLLTVGGNPVKPAMHVGNDAHDMSVQADGRVMVHAPGGKAVEAGRIELVRFNDMSVLQTLGDGLYRASESAGDPVHGRAADDGSGRFAQGFAEASNVRLVDEMVNLMLAQRAYEMNVKLIQASDEMLAMSNNLRRQ